MRPNHEPTHETKGVIFRPLLLVSLLTANTAGGLCEVYGLEIWKSSIVYVLALLLPQVLYFFFAGKNEEDENNPHRDRVSRLPSSHRL